MSIFLALIWSKYVYSYIYTMFIITILSKHVFKVYKRKQFKKLCKSLELQVIYLFFILFFWFQYYLCKK